MHVGGILPLRVGLGEGSSVEAFVVRDDVVDIVVDDDDAALLLLVGRPGVGVGPVNKEVDRKYR